MPEELQNRVLSVHVEKPMYKANMYPRGRLRKRAKKLVVNRIKTSFASQKKNKQQRVKTGKDQWWNKGGGFWELGGYRPKALPS